MLGLWLGHHHKDNDYSPPVAERLLALCFLLTTFTMLFLFAYFSVEFVWLYIKLLLSIVGIKI